MFLPRLTKIMLGKVSCILQVMQTCSGVTDDGVGMFLECYWYGKEYDCSDLFKLRPTDSGFCCSFNTLAMEEQL